MVLIDTSAWIAATRESGDQSLRRQVTQLIQEGEAAWCAAVRLELWPGAKGRRELDRLTALLDLVVDLEMTAAVWETAIALAGRARRAGVNCPFPDLLIAACATVHGLELLHRDKHLDWLSSL